MKMNTLFCGWYSSDVRTYKSENIKVLKKGIKSPKPVLELLVQKEFIFWRDDRKYFVCQTKGSLKKKCHKGGKILGSWKLGRFWIIISDFSKNLLPIWQTVKKLKSNKFLSLSLPNFPTPYKTKIFKCRILFLYHLWNIVLKVGKASNIFWF